MLIVLTTYDKIILLGVFCFQVNDYTDSMALDFLDRLDCFNLVQHVQSATHRHGNTLNLVAPRGINVDI